MKIQGLICDFDFQQTFCDAFW